MLEFGNNAATPAADLIKDSNEAGFMADVVEASKETPVIVDFWAPWCGPCKTLGPALEAAVTAAGGKVKMVKVNVDENQQIAAQMRVQSIPAVFAFVDGQPVDGFMGNKSPGEIKSFVEKTAALGGDDGLGQALEMAEQMLTDGENSDAVETFAAIVGEDASNAPAYAGLIRAHLALGEVEKAQELLDNCPEDLAATPEVTAVKAQMQLAAEAEKAGPLDDLKAAVAADPEDLQARFDLATALVAAEDVEAAITALLDIFGKDREWNDGAAKVQLFKVFDSLKPEDPVVLAGRRRLSSMIFA